MSLADHQAVPPADTASASPEEAADSASGMPRHKARLIWAGIAVVIVIAAGSFGYRYWSADTNGSTYRFASVTRGPITAAVIATGTVNPVTTVQVGSQVSGQIKELLADFNTEVKKGQLIARINPDTFETQVAQAEADVAAAKAAVLTQNAALLKAQADLEAAHANAAAAQAQTAKTKAALADAIRDYERKRRLAETAAESIAARDTALATRDQAQAQLAANQAQEMSLAAAIRSAEAQIKTAEAGIESARAQVLQKQAVLRHAQVNLDHTFIRAPVDGTVILRNVDVGQTVAASLQAPVLFTIAQDLRAMQVDTSTDEADVGAVRLGQRVIFTVDAHPGRQFEGSVLQIRKSPQVVQNVVTYDVVVSAPNHELLLFPGLTANVRVITAHQENVVRVPNGALRYRPGGGAKPNHPAAMSESQVYVLDETGVPQAVTVKLGITDGAMTELLGGNIAEGQQLIIGEMISRPRSPDISRTLTTGPRL